VPEDGRRAGYGPPPCRPSRHDKASPGRLHGATRRASLSLHPAAAPNLVPRQKLSPPQHATRKPPKRQLFCSRPLPPHIGCLERRGPIWRHQLQQSAALRRPQRRALELPSELPSPGHSALSPHNFGLLGLMTDDMVAVYRAGVASMSSGQPLLMPRVLSLSLGTRSTWQHRGLSLKGPTDVSTPIPSERKNASALPLPEARRRPHVWHFFQ